jgi:hypothetical protein
MNVVAVVIVWALIILLLVVATQAARYWRQRDRNS